MIKINRESIEIYCTLPMGNSKWIRIFLKWYNDIKNNNYEYNMEWINKLSMQESKQFMSWGILWK